MGGNSILVIGLHLGIINRFLKGKAKSKVMLQLMHSMCKSYSKTVVYFIHAPSVLRKKANLKQPHGAAMLSSAMT